MSDLGARLMPSGGGGGAPARGTELWQLTNSLSSAGGCHVLPLGRSTFLQLQSGVGSMESAWGRATQPDFHWSTLYDWMCIVRWYNTMGL